VKLRVITKQLSKKLPLENKLQKLTSISHDNFENIYKFIHSKKITELHVTDATYSNKIRKGKTVQVKDHINKTGSSILIGRQALLNIDFIDMTETYSFEKKAIITVCCGETLNKKFDYPSYFLCHITILAHALKIPTIKGFLYNTL
jgi:hypothetical protein